MLASFADAAYCFWMALPATTPQVRTRYIYIDEAFVACFLLIFFCEESVVRG